jgi:hypothetical protein
MLQIADPGHHHSCKQKGNKAFMQVKTLCVTRQPYLVIITTTLSGSISCPHGDIRRWLGRLPEKNAPACAPSTGGMH